MSLVVFLVVVGCSSPPESCTDVGNGVGECAPDLTLPRANGGVWSLAEQRNRVVLIQLAAAWCGTCQVEAPIHQALLNEYEAEGLTKATVLKGDADFGPAEQADAEAWKSYFELSHPVLYDEDKQVWKTWKRDVNSLPQLFLVDGQNTIRWRRIGMAPEDVLREQIEEHLRHLD